jgi:hypothetical protein
VTVRWPRRRRVAAVFALFVGSAGFGFGVLTYRHAWAFTHFVKGGRRTPPPDQLAWRDRLGPFVHGAVLPRPRYRRIPDDLGLPYIRNTVTTSDGLRLEGWYIAAPEARGTALLLHGYADSKESMLDVARELRGMGWSSYLIDFRGSGGSDGVATTIGVHEGRDVAAAWQASRAFTPRGGATVIYGASMGSAAALRAIAHEGVAPDGLVLAAPFDSLLRTVSHRFEPFGLPAFPTAHLLVFWGGVQHGFDGFAHNPVDYAASVQCPTLVLHGSKDQLATPEEARSVYERLAGPKTFHLFEGLGHVSFLRQRPDEWRRAIQAFLADVGGRS